MSLIAWVSAKGSPGLTTSALAVSITWPRPVLLAECDPAGGDVLAGFFGGGVAATRGVLGVAGAVGRSRSVDVAAELVSLDNGDQRSVLAGISDPGQAAALSSRWSALGEAFSDLRIGGVATDVLADCGRLGATYAPVPVLRRADAVVLVLRSSLRSVQAATGWVRKLGDDLAVNGRGAARLAALLVGDGQPYGHGDIARHLGVPLVGVLAWDPKAASVLSDGEGSGRGLARSPLLRTARGIGSRLSRATGDNAHTDGQQSLRRPRAVDREMAGRDG